VREAESGPRAGLALDRAGLADLEAGRELSIDDVKARLGLR
jgi:hypothetical protein